MEYADSHREYIVDVDVDIESDGLSATSSDTCMSSNDGEISQQYWDGCSDDVMTDFDDIDEINNPPHLDDENNIHRILLMFIML